MILRFVVGFVGQSAHASGTKTAEGREFTLGERLVAVGARFEAGRAGPAARRRRRQAGGAEVFAAGNAAAQALATARVAAVRTTGNAIGAEVVCAGFAAVRIAFVDAAPTIVAIDTGP